MRILPLLLLAACDDVLTPGQPGDSADTGEVDTADPDDTADSDSDPGDSDPDDTSADDTGADDTGADDTGADDTGWYGPAAYPAGAAHSPITPYVADHLHAIATLDEGLHDDVFMKVGDSITVSPSALGCYATTTPPLGDHDDLAPTIAWFQGGDAEGATPFARTSLAAKIGRSAVWAVTGDPSPLEQEADAIAPRFAVVEYGTNDLQLGTTPETALWGFYENHSEVVARLVDRGIVPVVLSIPARTDLDSVGRWVPTYNAVIRGIAQQQQVPFVDYYGETVDLPSSGLGSDGVHPNAWSGGACALTTAGLAYGYNTRNLLVLQALDRMTSVVLDGDNGLDAGIAPTGDGGPDDPIAIGPLPWVDARDTSASPYDAWDAYACAPTDESGPEVIYRLHLDAPTRLRAIVLDRGAVDVDLHLLDASGPDGCLHRADRLISGTLPAGDYRFALDSWVDGTGLSREGPYLFVLVECDPDDPACDAPL